MSLSTHFRLRTRAGDVFFPALAACLLLLSAAGHRADTYAGWQEGMKHGPKMDIAAATFFGTESPEEFVGVGTTSDDLIVAFGNSWSPPFPTNVEPHVLGTDGEWQVPLYPKVAEKDADGNPVALPENNPNRTGFMVYYSADLRKIERTVRFGWGVASITACGVMKDDSVVIAGLATRNFRTVAESAKLLKIYPARRYEAYGPYEYEKSPQPGDVYVAKMDPDCKGFQWVWIFEGHRIPPKQIYEGPDGVAIFECRTLKSITRDGQKMREAMKFTSSGRRFLLGASPLTGSILVGGDYHHNTGREPWRKPVLDLYNLDGDCISRFYDWHGPLVGSDSFRLVSDSAVRKGCFLPNGDVLVYVWSDGGNAVGTQNPVDLSRGVPAGPMSMSMAGASVGSFCHLVRFSATNYYDASYTCLAAYRYGKPNSIIPSRLSGTRDGRIMVMGGAAGFLIQTTTRWYRATDQYRPAALVEGKVVGIRYLDNGWPDFIGEGGRGDFSAVYSAGFTNFLWSSSIAMCPHVDMRECKRGIVAVSRCGGPSCKDGRKPFFEEHDVAYWPEFLRTLRQQGEADAPSAGKRVWDRLSQDLRKEISALDPHKQPPDETKDKIYDELNRIVGDSAKLYEEALWKDCPFSDYEKKMISKQEQGALPEEDVADLNRRLFEKAFPKFVFVCPKSNRPPIVNAVQDEYGGGPCDGHIYLLEPVK